MLTHFSIISDHNPLTAQMIWGLKTDKPYRWICKLFEYHQVEGLMCNRWRKAR
jgi:hypothetical protein